MNYNCIHDWYATVVYVNMCIHKYQFYLIVVVYFVFNATYIAVSTISWSFLLVEETGIHTENHRPTASYWRNLITYKKCLKMSKWKSEAVYWRTDKTMDNWKNTHYAFLEKTFIGYTQSQKIGNTNNPNPQTILTGLKSDAPEGKQFLFL